MNVRGSEFREIIAALREQGWIVEQTASGHCSAKPPAHLSDTMVHFALTSSDPRAIKNTIADLRRCGFTWPPPEKKSGTSLGSDDGMPSEEDIAREVERRGGVYAPVGDVAPPVAAEPAKPQTPEELMDSLYKELREALAYRALADEHLVERARVLDAAKVLYSEAEREHKEASERAADAKRRFDEHVAAMAAGKAA